MMAISTVVEVYRLDRYDNTLSTYTIEGIAVVEVYRLDRYDNPIPITKANIT